MRATAFMTPAVAPLLEVRHVSKRFGEDARARSPLRALRPKAGTVHALDDVSIAVGEREVVGLVGESGCGKSTLGRVVSRLLEPTEGERYWKGRPYAEYDARGQRGERLAVQMIFQDPSASLNPRMRVAQIVGEAPVVHGLVTSTSRRCCSAWASTPRSCNASRTSSPADSAAASASRGRSPCAPASSCATRRSPRSTSRSRRRC
jgi:ABC-type glutathione transport system ATPase component